MVAGVLSSLLCAVETVFVGAKMAVRTAVANSSSSVDVGQLLSGDGAAGDGGALSEVNKQVQEYGKGGFSIMQTIGVYAVAILIVAGGIGLAFAGGNAQKREEAKAALIYRFIAAILIFSGVAVLIFAQKIGSALFG